MMGHGTRMSRWVLPSSVVLVGVAVVLVVVAMQRPTASGPTGGSGPRVEPMRLTSIDGERISLPAGRPGMVMFSTSGCTSCIPSAQDMADVVASARQPVDGLYLSMDPGDNAGALGDRRESIGDPPYPFAIDTSGAMAAQYEVTALGTVLVYDTTGKIVARFVDPGADELRTAVRRARAS